MDYVIFTDTSANLPDKVVREYGLRQIPFFYCPPGALSGVYDFLTLYYFFTCSYTSPG